MPSHQPAGEISGLAALTDALLSAFDEQRAHDFGFGIAHDYQKLAHTGLPDQLRRYIVDPAKNVIARRAALMIARACSLRDLQADFLTVALNPADNPSIRAHAVSAIGAGGDEDVKLQLLPLARGEIGPDPHQEIKGRALEILWPSHLTSAEVFRMITSPEERFVGAYVMFLTRNLPNSLAGANLLPALQWATEYVRTARRTGEFHTKQLADSIFSRAWEYTGDPEILGVFRDYAMLVLHRFHRLFLRHEDDDVQERLREDELETSDLEWLLSISPCGASPTAGINPQSLCSLIESVFYSREPSQFEALYDLAMCWQPLHQRYEALLDGIAIDSPRATQMREYHELTIEHVRLKPPQLHPPPADRVRMSLESFQGGDLCAWVQLNLDLSLEPASTHYDPFQYKIVAMPGWITADEATRQHILSAAQKYLIDAQPQVRKWLGRNNYRHGDLSAYRALVLLRDVDQAAYQHLDLSVWVKWVPVVVAVPKETGTENGKYHDAIAADAAAKAPGEFARTVQWLIRAERRRSRAQPPPQTASEIRPFWI